MGTGHDYVFSATKRTVRALYMQAEQRQEAARGALGTVQDRLDAAGKLDEIRAAYGDRLPRGLHLSDPFALEGLAKNAYSELAPLQREQDRRVALVRDTSWWRAVSPEGLTMLASLKTHPLIATVAEFDAKVAVREEAERLIDSLSRDVTANMQPSGTASRRELREKLIGRYSDLARQLGDRTAALQPSYYQVSDGHRATYRLAFIAARDEETALIQGDLQTLGTVARRIMRGRLKGTPRKLLAVYEASDATCENIDRRVAIANGKSASRGAHTKVDAHLDVAVKMLEGQQRQADVAKQLIAANNLREVAERAWLDYLSEPASLSVRSEFPAVEPELVVRNVSEAARGAELTAVRNIGNAGSALAL